MEKSNKRKVASWTAIALWGYFCFFIGVHIGGFCRKSTHEGLPRAVFYAQKTVDGIYGTDYFLHGLNKVVRDGEKDFYGFFITPQSDNFHTNLLVEVDLTRTPRKINVKRLPARELQERSLNDVSCDFPENGM